MSPPMPLTKFQLNPTYRSKSDVASRFSSWPPWRPSWILERNELAIRTLHVIPVPPTMLWLNPINRSGADVVWRCHLGYRNGTILAILNLYIAPMPPTKFQLYPTYGSGGDVVWRFSRWPIWWPVWILEQNDFCNSNSPCGPNASHQVLA